MRATVVELFNNCWNKSRQCWMQQRHLWPSTRLSAAGTRCQHGTVLAPKLSTGEWGRRDRSFPPQDRDATYHHQPGPQETTPLIGPGSQISGAAPAGSCFAPVLHQMEWHRWHRMGRRWRRAALAAPQLSSRLSRALPQATVAMGKTPPPTYSPLEVEIRAHQY